MANKGIILSDQEREELLELSGSGDSALALRATIILDCANHKMIKEIATNHHIDGRTIRKWRTRFLEKGVKGLIVPNTGVSVTKSTEIVATTQRVKELVKAHNGAITPKAIASELGLNITKVYRILDKENISVVRQRSTNWLYTTADQQVGNGPYLAGLYLSCSFKAYILCDTNEPLDGKTIHGVVWMRDAAFAKEMENSASTLRLADTLYAATTHMDFRHAGNGITCKDFITEVIDSWPEGADYRFRVLYLGETFPGYQGDRILGIQYSSFDSFSELRRYVLMQYVDPDDESRYQSVRKLLKVADDYVHVQQPGSDPFVWRMLYGEYTPLKTILNSDEVNGVTDDASTIEKAMEGLFDLETIEVGNSCIKTVICMKDSSGQLTFRVVGGNSLFPGIDEGCISTPEAFERTINQLDREMSDLSRKVDLAGRELFLTNLKKKQHVLGTLIMIEIEFCIGRMVTFAPMTVASYLQAGQRYLTQEYEEVICDLVTTLSYRDGNSAFNKRYGRKGDEQLSLSTFVKDVLANGTRLIEAKETEAKRILEEYGFNYETGLYKDDVLPESLCNNLPDMIVISPREDIMHPPDDEWDSAHPNAEIPSKYLYKHRKKSKHSEIDVPAKDVKMLEKEEEHQYSKPDDTPFKYPQKRRSKRIEVSSERKPDMINDYVEWRNSHVRHDSSKVLYLWGVELDSSQVIYIHPDADLVPKQCGTHVKGGKSALRDKKENVVHWNIQVEWDGKSYGITGTRQSVYPQLRAFLLENHLTQRYFIFFSDGESCIYDDIEKWFYCWHYVIYLDFHHAKKKVYELISLAIKSERVEDPSDDPGEYHRGPNKGKPKPKKKTSLSRLYGKVVVSALFAGNWKEAILYLRDINPDDVVKPDALNDLIKYIWRKRHYITCYCIRKKCGLRNSSNGSEGLNNQNVSRRQKSDQKNWCDHGSYAVASLTNCFKNRENTRWFRERKFSFAYVECEEDE